MEESTPLTPIGIVERQERLERALLAIEALALEGCEEDQTLGRIYMIAHAALGLCQAPHDDWLQLIEQCEEYGRENKLYDAGKVLDKPRRTTAPAPEKV